jgi:membrane-associated protease RseP (regulator of RpoE activity)
MSQGAEDPGYPPPGTPQGGKKSYSIWLGVALFFATFFTTTVAGVQWIGEDPFELTNLGFGLTYAAAILFVLGVHEFGHYFAARHHRVEVTLPYFIPFPPTPFFLNFGTLGALIRTKSVVPSRKAMFDIGVAGPLAGFLACFLVLTIGFFTLPDRSFILSIHPAYDFLTNSTNESHGLPLEFGQTLLYRFLSWALTDPSKQFVPPMSEIYHYPLLCVGWFGLFVTAMNLIPIGQYDGGHLAYTMWGNNHRKVSLTAFVGLLILGLPSVVDTILREGLGYFSDSYPGQIIPFAQYSWSGWFLWALISFYVVKLHHPPVHDETPLDERRVVLGWLTFAIFILCFSFSPFTI